MSLIQSIFCYKDKKDTLLQKKPQSLLPSTTNYEDCTHGFTIIAWHFSQLCKDKVGEILFFNDGSKKRKPPRSRKYRKMVYWMFDYSIEACCKNTNASQLLHRIYVFVVACLLFLFFFLLFVFAFCFFFFFYFLFFFVLWMKYWHFIGIHWFSIEKPMKTNQMSIFHS